MKFLESSDDGWAAEAERMAAEIEQQKKEWELGRLQALKEEEERMAHNSDEEIITYSSADAHNQVNIKKKKVGEKGQAQPIGGGRRRGGRTSKAKTVFEDQSDDYSSTDSDTDLSESEDENMSASEGSISSSEEAFVTFRKKSKVERDAEMGDKVDERESRSGSTPPKVLYNKVSEDSPRTRSRGRVKINLWTLDVNPVLPGERPVPFSRKQLANLRGQGLPIPGYEGSDSPCHSEDRSRNNSGQTMNGELEGDGEGEDMEVDVVGDSGDSSNIDGTGSEANGRGDPMEDVTGSLKASGPPPTQITVHNGVGL